MTASCLDPQDHSPPENILCKDTQPRLRSQENKGGYFIRAEAGLSVSTWRPSEVTEALFASSHKGHDLLRH